MRQFSAAVRGLHAGTIFAKQLVRLPDLSSGLAQWISPMDHVASLWADLNADVGPLVLTGGYTQAQFAIDNAALKTLYTNFGEAERLYREALLKRDAKFAEVYSKLVLYRQAIQGSFAMGDPYLDTLPRLTRKRKPKKVEPEPEPAEV